MTRLRTAYVTEWLREMRAAVLTIGHDVNVFESDIRPKMSRRHIEDACRKAADDGCNTLHWGVGHYRWNFINYFDEIERFIRDAAEIGHKHGLKVCEHHSVVLFSQPVPGLTYKNWRMDEFYKIDFRDGSPYYTNNWKAYVYCCTNPGFRDACLDIARRFVLTPAVDLYMPDDMGLANSFYDCACIHCRKLFHEMTGYTAPEVGNLDLNFFHNIENPAWRAWVRFRSVKVGLFLKEVREFLDSEGGQDIAMTTCNSDQLSTLVRMMSHDEEEHVRGGRLDSMFHEMCEPQSFFWPRSVVERQAIIGISEHLDVPAIAHPYPASNEETVFAQLMHLSHGQCYNCTRDNDAYVNNDNYGVNRFAAAHTDLFHARPASNLAAVFSRNTRDFYGKDIFTRTYLETHCDELAGWCEFAMRINYPFRVIPEGQVEDGKLDGIDVLVLPNCACMSEKGADAVRRFAENGGTLIATNETSVYQENGDKRQDFLLADLLGLRYINTDRGISYSIIKNTANADTVLHYTFSNFPKDRYDPALRDAIWDGIATVRLPHHGQQAVVDVTGDNVQVLAHSPIMEGFGYGHASLALNRFGKGRVFYFSGLPGLMCHMITSYSHSQYGEDPFEYIPPIEPRYGKLIQNILKTALAGNSLFTITPVIEGIYVNYSALPDGSRKYIHLNATPRLQFENDGIHYKGLRDLWENPSTEAGNPHVDPRFWQPGLDYVEIPELELTLHDDVGFSQARMAGIEFSGWIDLPIERSGGRSIVRIPASTVGRYAFIELS